MSAIEFEFECNSLRYDLTLKNRVSVILGETATGKSRLAHTAFLAGVSPKSAVVRGANGIAALTNTNWGTVLSSNVDIVVIDEEILLGASGDIWTTLQQYDHLYILIGRARLAEMPVSASDVYELRQHSAQHYYMSSCASDANPFVG